MPSLTIAPKHVVSQAGFIFLGIQRRRVKSLHTSLDAAATFLRVQIPVLPFPGTETSDRHRTSPGLHFLVCKMGINDNRPCPTGLPWALRGHVRLLDTDRDPAWRTRALSERGLSFKDVRGAWELMGAGSPGGSTVRFNDTGRQCQRGPTWPLTLRQLPLERQPPTPNLKAK